MGPLLADEGSRGERASRRLKAIASEAGLLALTTLLLPVLLGAAALVDLVLWGLRRKPWIGVRLVLMLWWFLYGELRGILGLGLIWVASAGRDTRRRRRRVYRLRQQWAGSHLSGVSALFGLSFKVEGLELAGPGPVLILMRHASIIDNTLPDSLIGRAHDLGLRFVLKRELQMLPTIDIGGRWVPTNFVRRGTGDTERELVALRRLAIDIGPDEGVLIYPEGTRHTPEKLLSAQAKIAERQPEVAPLANRLQHVLPPRLGGPLALLEASRGADVVYCGHVGLDGFERISDIWKGGLVGTTVQVKFWRYAAAEVPSERDAMIQWLYAGWQTLDDWVGRQRPGTQPAGNAPAGTSPA